MSPLKLALLTTDNREAFRKYEREEPYFGTAPTALMEGFAELGGGEIEVDVVSCTQRPVPAPEKLAPNIRFHSLVVPKIGWLRSGYSGCILAARRKLAGLKPDIVHSQGTERDNALNAIFSPFPRVLTVHGNMRLIASMFREPIWSATGLQSKLEGFVIPRFDGVVCISSYTQKAVEDLSRRTWLLPNAVDGSFFHLKAAPVQPLEVLYVGTVEPRKNQNAFLDAIAPLAELHDFRVRFFGEADPNGEYGREFFARTEKFSWASYGGMVGRPELKECFVRAGVLVLPSLEDNCPMTVLEAMASGVPVLASAVGGIPDLVKHEVTGLLCDPHRAESMREMLGKILADTGLRTRLAAQAQESALQRFLPRVVAREHLRIYREVINAKEPSRK